MVDFAANTAGGKRRCVWHEVNDHPSQRSHDTRICICRCLPLTGHVLSQPNLKDLDKQITHSEGNEGERIAGSPRRILSPAMVC